MERKTANISKLPLEQSNSARARYLLFNLPLSTRCSKINGDGHPHSQGKALGNEADKCKTQNKDTFNWSQAGGNTREWRVLPDISYIGMYCRIGYGF